MAAKWKFDSTRGAGGRFRLVITKLTKGGLARDVTEFRRAPTKLDSFSSADPFGDAVASFTFPSITPFDDLDAPEIGSWLGYYSNVDLYWVPAIAPPSYNPEQLIMDPATNEVALVGPADVFTGAGVFTTAVPNQVKVWEGFLASMDFTGEDSSAALQIQCQGALFQLDRYNQKPFYPPRPYPLEALVAQAFDHAQRPHLRTQHLKTVFPAGWTKKAPPYQAKTASLYTPNVSPGTLWTGFTSRDTGGWDRALTGFVQKQISLMITTDDSGVTPGNQWTVLHTRAAVGYSPGRQPVLQVRDRFRAPDFAMWYGTPGMSIQITGDSTQSSNILYGDGVGLDGTGWRLAQISPDGGRTDYLPLAAAAEVYPQPGPHVSNPAFDPNAFATEAYQKYDTGFGQDQAVIQAKQTMQRDRQPGWAGTITLKTDPRVDLSRWQIQAGMTILLQGFAGTGETGMPFHIASVEASPMDGSVSLTVDTRYRDLLNLQEALIRSRDPLTPSKLLQVGHASAIIQDLQAPWDYSAGSGYVPRGSKGLFDHLPMSEPFPYVDWIKRHPPMHYPQFYAKCNIMASARAGRWSGAIPVLTAEKADIARTEFLCVDVFGNPYPIPFHVSFYKYNVTTSAMPHDAQGPSAFIPGAFNKIDPRTGGPFANSNLWADDSMLNGWGSVTWADQPPHALVYQRAGFSPGAEDLGNPCTGLFVDEAQWHIDNTYQDFFVAPNAPGKKAPTSAITIYAMIYAEVYPLTPAQPAAYFIGRLYKQNQGT